MAVSRKKKEEILKNLNDKLSRSKAAVFVDYSGTDVKSMDGMRRDLRNGEVDFKIAKKTLLNLAFKQNDVDIDIKTLPGQVAIAIGYKDEVAPARIIFKFAKNLKTVKIIAGLLGKEFMASDKIKDLAELPSYEELLARVAGSIQAPVAGFVNVLQGNMRGLAQVLSAISKK